MENVVVTETPFGEEKEKKASENKDKLLFIWNNTNLFWWV